MIYLEFNHEILRTENLDDGPVLCMDAALGNLRYRLLIEQGQIKNGSVVTKYRQDGTSEQQYVFHNYMTNIQVLDAEEKEESCLVGGAYVSGKGLVIGGRKWGKWTGDTFEGCFNNDKPCGTWTWDQEETLLSGEVIITTKNITINGGGGSQAIEDAPDTFRRDWERTRTELANRG